jgi:alpha-galactosidase
VQLTSAPTETPPLLCLSGIDLSRHYQLSVLSLADGPGLQELAPPPWLSHGPLAVSGQVLTEVGVQMPILQPEQAFLMHLTEV